MAMVMLGLEVVGLAVRTVGLVALVRGKSESEVVALAVRTVGLVALVREKSESEVVVMAARTVGMVALVREKSGFEEGAWAAQMVGQKVATLATAATTEGRDIPDYEVGVQVAVNAAEVHSALVATLVARAVR